MSANAIKHEILAPGCEIYLGDCMTVLPILRGGADAVVTDPPYGINAARDRNSQKNGWRDYCINGWDLERPAQAVFSAILAAARYVILWGGNYFSDYLPPSQCWLIWDKGQRSFSLADCELAWCSMDKASRIFSYSRGAAMQDGKQHPTQKPIELMIWTIRHLDKADIILDPFMGSGTTGVAAIKLGRKFIGIEIEPKYYEIARARLIQAIEEREMDMFKDHAPEIIQEQII